MNYLTEKAVAEMLNVSKYTLRTWRNRGEGPPAVLLGPRTPRYPRAGLEQWLASRTTKAA